MFKSHVLLSKFYQRGTHGTELNMKKRVKDHPRCTVMAHPRGKSRPWSCLQDSLASVDISVDNSTTRKKLAHTSCMADIHSKNHWWARRRCGLILTLPKKKLMTFVERHCGLPRQKLTFLGGARAKHGFFWKYTHLSSVEVQTTTQQ